MGRRLTKEEFIRRAELVHGSKYDYSKVIYKNGDTKVTIICPEHDEFQQRARCHIVDKQGCPICATFQRKATCLERYGIELPGTTPEAYEKRKQALIAKYGVDNPFYLPEVQAKIKQTMLRKYGVENSMQSPEIQAKSQKTQKENSTWGSSNAEEELYITLCEIFGEDDIIRQ